MLGLALQYALAQPPVGVPPVDFRGREASKLCVALSDVLCSLNVVDWDLAKVLKVLSQQTQTNLITLSGPAKKLTIRLSNVKLSEMILHICATMGMASLKSGGTTIIATANQLKAAYPVEWALANPQKVDPMLDMAADYYACCFVNSGSVADSLRKLFADQRLQIVPGQGSDGFGSKTILVRGPRPLVEAAVKLAHDLDRPQPQVAISIRVDDISNEALVGLSQRWDLSNLSVVQPKDGLKFGIANRSGFISDVMSLEQKGTAQLLCEPNLSALDGEKATVAMGSRLNFPHRTASGEGAFERQEEQIGISLEALAKIAPDGEITLTLNPRAATVSGILDANGASYPQIATREGKTTLRVHSGQTIIVSGLMLDDDLIETGKVPILAEMPMLADILKHRRSANGKSQVMICITPVVLPQGK